MKKAFTLIELIFVIVILGTLIGISVNKFMISKDDASNTVAAANIVTLVQKLNEYYISQGSLKIDGANVNEDILEMTGVNTPIKIGDEICLGIASITAKEVSLNIKTDGSCQYLWDFKSLAGLKQTFKKNENKIILGGGKIKF